MSNKLTGKIIEILPTEEGTSKAGKPWKKLVFAIDTGEEWNNISAFTLFGDEKVDSFLKFNKVGQSVDVDYNLSSRKYENRYYTEASAWKVFKAETLESGAALIDSAFEPAGDLNKDDNNDLPF
jgi:hypothetical protein